MNGSEGMTDLNRPLNLASRAWDPRMEFRSINFQNYFPDSEVQLGHLKSGNSRDGRGLLTCIQGPQAWASILGPNSNLGLGSSHGQIWFEPGTDPWIFPSQDPNVGCNWGIFTYEQIMFCSTHALHMKRGGSHLALAISGSNFGYVVISSRLCADSRTF